MIISIIAIIALLGIFVLLAYYFRAGVTNLVQGIAANAMATWLDFTTIVWPAIRATVLIALALSLIPWLLLLIIMIILGSYSNSTISAMVITFLLPIWFLAFIMPPFASRIWVVGPIIRIARSVFGPVLIVATVFLLFGVWSPDIKSGFHHWASENKLRVARFADKSACERKMDGVIVEVKENSVLYNCKGVSVGSVRMGEKVKVVDFKDDSSIPKGSEAMARIMLPNQYGDFTGEYIVRIPIRKLKADA